MAITENPTAPTAGFAIIGYAARLPGAVDTDQFWDVLRSGRDAVSEIPQDRWDVDEFFDPDPAAPGKVVTRRAGFVDDAVGVRRAIFRSIGPRGQIDGSSASDAAGDLMASGGAFGHRTVGLVQYPHRRLRRSVHP